MSPGSPPPEVEVRRSRRRKRTVSAYRRDGRVVVMIPDWFSPSEEAEWVAQMLRKLDRADRRTRSSDADLERRAARLSAEFLDGLAEPASVRWVDNMTTRWGSCTPASRTIRLSERLRTMPTWVQDYVLVHELTHLLEPGHGPRFWAWVDRYPKSQRAQGYLEGIVAAGHLGIEPCD